MTGMAPTDFAEISETRTTKPEVFWEAKYIRSLQTLLSSQMAKWGGAFMMLFQVNAAMVIGND